MFHRFPDLRVASIENGGDWVVPFLDHLADVYRKMPQEFDEDPIEAFKRNVCVSPFHEDNIERLIERRSAPTTCCSGRTTRIPRAWPNRLQLRRPPAAGLSDDDVAAIMGGNLAGIMRVPVKV